MVLRFGPFELDGDRDELRRSGLVLRLPHQPSRLLAMLLRRAGEVVTREEIREEIWGTGTHVDFEQGINAAIRQIRFHLGDNAEAPRYVKTIPRRGYVWIAPVETAPPAAAAAAGSSGSSVPRSSSGSSVSSDALRLDPWSSPDSPDAFVIASPPEELRGTRGTEEPAPPWHAKPGTRIAVAAALVLIAAAVLWLSFRGGRRTIAVAPFRAMAGLPAGVDPAVFAQELRSTVGALSSTYVVVLEERSNGDAQVRIEGTIQRAGDIVRVIVSGIDTASRTQIWTETYERRLGEHQDMAMQTAHLVAHEVARRYLPPPQREPRLRTKVPPRVLERYRQARIEGRRSLPDPDGNRAAALFEQALRDEPRFPEALSGLADIWLQRAARLRHPNRGAAIAKSREYAARALALQPENAEARSALGLIALQYEWNVTAAEQAFREAVRNDPRYVDARFNLSMTLAARGELDDAIETYEQVRALDPVDFDLFPAEGMLYLRARRYEEAIARYREILRFRESAQSTWGILWASTKRRDRDQATSVLRTLLGMPPPPPGVRATEKEFRDLFRNLEKVVLTARDRGKLDEYHVAAYYSERGERGDLDLAFAALHRAVENRSPILAYLLVDPRFDALRNDPRYPPFAARIR